MGVYSIQFRDGPQLDITAETRELAWDEYKKRTGLRRTITDDAPKVIEVPALLAGDVDYQAGPSTRPKGKPKAQRKDNG